MGNTINLNSSGVPTGAVPGLMLLGTTEFTSGIRLAFFGLPTCRAYNSLDASAVFLPVAGAGNQPLSIPGNPALAGVVIRSRGAAFVPGINAFGFLPSNGMRLALDIKRSLAIGAWCRGGVAHCSLRERCFDRLALRLAGLGGEQRRREVAHRE